MKAVSKKISRFKNTQNSFCLKSDSDKLEKRNERAIRSIYQDKDLSFRINQGKQDNFI